MTDNAQKTPFAQTLLRVGAKTSANSEQGQGQSLPCSVVSVNGAIVTVKFEVTSAYTLPNVTMPLFGPEYIRYPIQVGDKGFAIPANAYLGGVSGLGGGTADLSQRANLSNLVFFPIGHKDWTVVDPQSVTIYGPNGVVLRDTGAKSSIIIIPNGVAIVGQNSVTITCGQCSINMTPTSITITDPNAETSPTTMNQMWAAFINTFNSHVHGNGNGGGNTTQPTVPYTGGNIAP